MWCQPMVKQVIPSNPTHGKCHSSLYKSNHGNDNLTHFPIGQHSFWRTILQNHPLRDVVPSSKGLHSGQSIY